MKAGKEKHWKILSYYQKFEEIIALVLTFIIAVVIVVSIARLSVEVIQFLIDGAIDPLKPQSFKTLFGMIMTVLIALEFKHSILEVVARQASIVQVKTVILIALLAISRKFIILDTETYSPLLIASLAASILALGIVYWLMRSRDDKENNIITALEE